MKVHFPDGTVVTACSLAERRADVPDRDFGLYMDAAWRPTWDADLIEWQDFGVPTVPMRAAKSIVAAFHRATAGQRVEIGCLGGLGRTGTVLACMAILAGVPPADAVAWVRKNYRSGAIEGKEQEHWIGWFAEQMARE